MFYFFVCSSYDETDDDCLSPNLDEILSTEIVEDVNIANSNLRKNKHPYAAMDRPDMKNYDPSNGYVNLTSIYTTPVLEKVVLTSTAEKYTRNGYPDRPYPGNKTPTNTSAVTSPENPLGQSANTSFLYSQLLSPTKGQVSPKDNFENNIIYANIQQECVPNASIINSADFNKHLSGSPLNKVSFASGISDNFEKSLKHSLSEDPVLKKEAKTNVTSNSKYYQDDEDEGDYARDSDECSIQTCDQTFSIQQTYQLECWQNFLIASTVKSVWISILKKKLVRVRCIELLSLAYKMNVQNIGVLAFEIIILLSISRVVITDQQQPPWALYCVPYGGYFKTNLLIKYVLIYSCYHVYYNAS